MYLSPEEKIDLDLGDEVYVGIFVCSHNAMYQKKPFLAMYVSLPAPADW
jgi:TolB protein